MRRVTGALDPVPGLGRIAKRNADDSSRRRYHAFGTGCGFALASITGLVLLLIDPGLPWVAVFGLCAAPLLPGGGLLGEWLWRRSIRNVFSNPADADRFFSSEELLRRVYQQQLRDIDEAKLPASTAEALKISVLRMRIRHERILIDTIAVRAPSAEPRLRGATRSAHRGRR